jgi:hypothetical protein
MNKEIIKNEITWLLEAINEQYEAIHRHGEKIPQIEFDILMENVRKFYENMQLLRRLNDRLLSQEPKQAAMMQKPEAKGKIIEPEPAKLIADVADDPSPEPLQINTIPFKPSDTEFVRQESSASARKKSASLEIDLFGSEEPTFSIKLKEAREKTFGPKTVSEHIENLKSAITINEKFMFINELFDGNLREYNETIETLNGFKNLDQAADFLDLMRKKNFWNTGSDAFKKIKELVERRY